MKVISRIQDALRNREGENSAARIPLIYHMKENDIKVLKEAQGDFKSLTAGQGNGDEAKDEGVRGSLYKVYKGSKGRIVKAMEGPHFT